jgi:drug/metabolite transporter (DMT)-like permease
MKMAIAVVLIVAGALALVYRGFSYTKERHEAKLGPLELHVEEKERVRIPVWAGAIAIAGGVVLLIADRKKK